MKRKIISTFFRSTKILMASIFAMMMASGSAALASNSEKLVISGNSTFALPTECDGEFALVMTGDLEGCLKIMPKRIDCDELNGFDLYTEKGKELFEGTLDGVYGEFETRYVVRGTYASGFCDALSLGDPNAFALQLSGGCIHNVRGKSGVFEDVKGLFRVYDVIPGITAGGAGMPDPAGFGASNFLYEGFLKEAH